MLDINKTIINLLNQNKNMREISSILNISEKQLYIRIKQIIDYGYILTPSYSYDADIYYKIEKELKPVKNEIKIGMPSSNREFRIIVISDLHKGNIDSDIKLSNIVYEYASKNGINIILFCGDMLENVYSSDKKSINNIYKQTETFVKKYPYDKNIINIGILGNHEYHSLTHDGLDIAKHISRSRYDIIPIGYGKGIVKIRDDSLYLKHKLENGQLPDEDEINSKIVLSGHGHMMKTKFNDRLYLCVPTLSYVSPDKTKEVTPGFIDMTLYLEKNKFEFVEAHHMIITDKIQEISRSTCKIEKLFNNVDNEKQKRIDRKR